MSSDSWPVRRSTERRVCSSETTAGRPHAADVAIVLEVPNPVIGYTLAREEDEPGFRIGDVEVSTLVELPDGRSQAASAAVHSVQELRQRVRAEC